MASRTVSPGKAPSGARFVERHGLWTPAQERAARAVEAAIKKHKLELIRFSFADQHGVLRGKTVVASEAVKLMRAGVTMTTTLLAKDTSNKEGRYLLAMALIAKNEHARASAILDKLLAEGPNASAYYARALAHHGLKRKAEAKSDIDNAIRLGLDNPDIRAWQAKIGAMR